MTELTPIAVPENAEELEARLKAFVRSDAPSAMALRQLVDGPFIRFDRLAIIGGMVRDFARCGMFASDIDIVIEASSEDVATVAASIGASRNAFGGWRITLDGTDFDFWALETTWVVTNAIVEASRVEDMIKTTFFDHDAVVFDLRSERIICEEDYLLGLRQRRIEINVRTSPIVDGNLYRAVTRILRWDLIPGPRLSEFIDAHLDEHAFGRVRDMDSRKGSAPFLSEFGSGRELRNSILARTR